MRRLVLRMVLGRRSHGRPQEYRTTCLLGCETDTYDSEGAQVRVAPWRHVTREQVEEALQAFRGELMQAPPMLVTDPNPLLRDSNSRQIFGP